MTTIIRRGTVVTATDSFAADVLIEGETITAIGVDLSVDADTVIDAEGCLVLPGLIDNHTHLDMPFADTKTADDFATGTAAAAAGGTTCIVDFARQLDGSLERGLAVWREKAEDKAHIDYAFHLTVTDASAGALREVARVAADGVTSFKLFMAYRGALMIDDRDMLAVLEAVGEVGGLCLVHAENGDAVEHNIAKALAVGHVDPKFHATTRPPVVEQEATARAIRLAQVVGQPLFVVHVTCRESLREVEYAREMGLPVAGETCTHYLVLTADELARPGFEGAKYVCSPPLRKKSDQEALWLALRHRALGIVSSDHCPFNFAGQKEMGRGDFSRIPNGMPGIESRLPLLFTHGVRGGRITVNELVSLAATEPARIFGLAPKKGSLVPGADADIVVFDPDREHVITATSSHGAADYTPFEGFVCLGAPRRVLSRGETVFENGEIVSDPGRGRYVPRSPCGQAVAGERMHADV